MQRIEKDGNVSPETIMAVASAFSVMPDELSTEYEPTISNGAVSQVLNDSTRHLLSDDGEVVLTERAINLKAAVINSFNSVLGALAQTIKTMVGSAKNLDE